MNSHRTSVRPRLELLEDRRNPGTLTVSLAGPTLSITGDGNANDLTVRGDAVDATKFTLTSVGDAFAGAGAGPFTGVHNIKISMLGGNDTATFDNAVPIHLEGSLKIAGGDGANTVSAVSLTVDKDFAITNGRNNTGTDLNALYALNVGGGLTIKNGDGDSETDITGNGGSISTIAKNLNIINGSGKDLNQMYDMNVGGNVTIANGRGNGALAGRTWIYNAYNSTFRSVIRGNVTVSYKDGNGSSYDGIWDTEVRGNVSFNHGPGAFTTNFDEYVTNLPVIIRGNLSIAGTGAQTVTVGTQFGQAGMLVGKNLTIKTGNGADNITFNKLVVQGKTKLTLGDGANTISIDDSTFVGAFNLTTGSDADHLNLETTAGTSLPTIFEGPVLMRLGNGGTTVNREGGADPNQSLVVYSTFVIHHGSSSSISWWSDKEFFPFGTRIESVV
jgi:hypothetical protein